MRVQEATVYIVQCGDCGTQRNPKHDRAEAIVTARRAGWGELDDGTPICAACWRAYRGALEREAAKAQPRTQMDTATRVACPECWRSVAPDAADAVTDEQGLWLHGVCLTGRAVQS